MAPPIVFHFDFISPDAYLATLGPGEVPAKRIYTFKDVLRGSSSR